MRTSTTGLLCAVFACRGAAEGDSPAIDPKLRVVPWPIDFGVVTLGETSTPIFVTVENEGDEDIALDGFFPSSDALMVDDVDSFHLAPGRQETRTLRWTPVSTDTLHERLDVVVARSPSMTSVPVTGVPAFGVLDAPVGLRDLGGVPVGCAREFSFQISNEGMDELTLESVTFSGPDELTLYEGTLDCWSPPGNDDGVAARVLGPYESVDFCVEYAPTTPGTDAEATLHVESDALVHPVADATLTGHAVDGPGLVSDTWTVPPRPTALTSLVVVNAAVASSTRSALPSFFDVLRDSALPFRVAFIGTESDGLDPSVAGPYAFIDDTFSAEETDEAVGAMLDGIEGDEDRGLALLAVAIEEHRDWLLDADALWRSSTLHLTVVNDDAEQSPLIADMYVEQFNEFKDGAAPVVVNGIAGPPPTGCDGLWGPSAAPSEMLFDATQLTSGVFASICDDWNTNLALLAGHMLRPVFPLGDLPLDANITVTLDGDEIDTGWVYEPEINAIAFDEDSYPPEGSVVGIEYGPALECD